MAAKKMECVKPLCPNKCSYGIPNLKAKTSASGRIEQMTPSKINLVEVNVLEYVLPMAKATNACEKAEAKTNFYYLFSD